MVQAGSSGVGRDLAARVADVVFTAHPTLNDRQVFYKDMKARAANFGRAPRELLIMPGICPIVGRTEAEAREKLRYLNSLIDSDLALATLQNFMVDVDLKSLPLDEPLPEIPQTEGNQSRQKLALDMARRENMTLRQLAAWFAGTRGHWMPIGTAEKIVDEMEECFDAFGADGFNLLPATFPGELNDFISMVVSRTAKNAVVSAWSMRAQLCVTILALRRCRIGIEASSRSPLCISGRAPSLPIIQNEPLAIAERFGRPPSVRTAVSMPRRFRHTLSCRQGLVGRLLSKGSLALYFSFYARSPHCR